MDQQPPLPQDPIERATEVADYTMHQFVFRYHGISNGHSLDGWQDNLTDLLTNLRHWADARGLDFEYSVGWSSIHHEAELIEKRRTHA